jgi:hypothetical protein
VLRAPEIPQVPGEQLAAAHAAAVVGQVVVHKVGVTGVHTRVLVVLVFRAVARVVLVEDVVVVDQRIGRIREELEEELLDLGVEHAFCLPAPASGTKSNTGSSPSSARTGAPSRSSATG